MKPLTKRQMRKLNRKYRRKKIRFWINNKPISLYVIVIFFTIVVLAIVIFVGIIWGS